MITVGMMMRIIIIINPQELYYNPPPGSNIPDSYARRGASGQYQQTRYHPSTFGGRGGTRGRGRSGRWGS